MKRLCVSLSLCVLLVLSVSFVDSKRSGGRKPSNSGTTNRRHQDNRPKNTTSGFGGSHGGSNQHFLDSERHDANNRGHIGFEKFNNPSGSNPGGFSNQGNHRPSAPSAGNVPNQGIGGAFGGSGGYPAKTQNTHVQSAPYPTNNNPGGFGNAPAGGTHYQPGGFGTNAGNNPGGFGQSGGFGNPAGGSHHPPGGFGTNPAQSGGFGQHGGFGSNPASGGNYNQGGFGSNPASGTHYNNQGGFGNPASGGHYNQPGGFAQPGYGGNTHGSHYPAGNTYGGAQPNYPVGGYGGHQPNYGAGGYGGHQPNYPGGYGGHGGYSPAGGYPGGYGGHNPGGFGGGYGSSFGQGGGYGGYPQGGYKTKSGPGFGTGLLGGAAGALPLGLLLGYGLGSMTSHSSPSSPSSPAAPTAPGTPAAPANNEAYNTWLKQRTEEKTQEIVAKTGNVTAVNQTEIVNQILTETQMCPGGAGVLDVSILNTMVPCNVTQVDFNTVNVTEPVEDDCKTLSLSIVQVNTATNENKTMTLQIKQNNITGANEFVMLSYDVELVACTTPIHNPDGKLCATRAFTADRNHVLNETMSYLHTANVSITQFNTTLNDNCTASGACGPESKPPRNLTSAFINLSILPEYPLNIMLHQCMIFKTNSCDPAATTPCDAPLITTKQTIRTNTTLTKADFAYINFVLHESGDVFRAYTPPPTPPPSADEASGSSSSLTDTATKSSASAI